MEIFFILIAVLMCAPLATYLGRLMLEGIIIGVLFSYMIVLMAIQYVIGRK